MTSERPRLTPRYLKLLQLAIERINFLHSFHFKTAIPRPRPHRNPPPTLSLCIYYTLNAPSRSLAPHCTEFPIVDPPNPSRPESRAKTIKFIAVVGTGGFRDLYLKTIRKSVRQFLQTTANAFICNQDVPQHVHAAKRLTLLNQSKTRKKGSRARDTCRHNFLRLAVLELSNSQLFSSSCTPELRKFD